MSNLKRKRETPTPNTDDDIARNTCLGITKAGGKCCNLPSVDLGDAGQFCRQHRFQADGAPIPRTCDGNTISGESCKVIVRSAAADKPTKPTFCKLHRKQAINGGSASHTQCAGKDTSGARCENFIARQPPYSQFCRLHQGQEKVMTSPVTQLPDDVSTLVLDLLQPIDRVAFALCNRSCAKLVQSWGKRDHIPPHLTVASLTPFVIDKIKHPIEPFVMSTGPDPATQQALIELYAFCERTTTSKKERDKSGRFIIPPCECKNHLRLPSWKAVSPLYSLHDVRQSAQYTVGLTSARAPFLFPQTLGHCMSCKNSLSESLEKWASNRLPTAYRHQPARLCNNCMLNTDVYIRWCTACHREPGPLIIARAYWATQPLASASDEGGVNEENGRKKLKSRDNQAIVKEAKKAWKRKGTEKT